MGGCWMHTDRMSGLREWLFVWWASSRHLQSMHFLCDDILENNNNNLTCSSIPFHIIWNFLMPSQISLTAFFWRKVNPNKMLLQGYLPKYLFCVVITVSFAFDKSCHFREKCYIIMITKLQLHMDTSSWVVFEINLQLKITIMLLLLLLFSSNRGKLTKCL